MESLKKEPNSQEVETEPAKQAGVFLESHVLFDTIPPLTACDPIKAIHRVGAAQREFGDNMEIRATPGGHTQIFVEESALDDYRQREATKVEAELEALRPSHGPEPQG